MPAVALLIAMLPAPAAAQTYGPPLQGTYSNVNNGPGDQSDPHVSGDLVAYSDEQNGGSQIRYHNLVDNSDNGISTDGAYDFLSDINGSRVLFTRLTTKGSIFLFDIATAGPATELDPQPSTDRRTAVVGRTTVAWQELFSNTSASAEIIANDTAEYVSTRLTNDSALDQNPAVSPDGNVIAWTRCANITSGCDIYTAVKSGGWTVAALTGAEGEEQRSDTNGQLVVYSSARDGERDIYWKPVGGGTEQHLAIAGNDRNPSISGNLIAFEHFDANAGASDILLYDIAGQTLYQLTNTIDDESLNDIWVGTDGVARVVWTINTPDGLDVQAFTFEVPAPPVTCDPGPTTCADPGNRPLLASATVSRAPGHPNTSDVQFSSTPASPALVCVDGRVAGASGKVTLNGTALGGHGPMACPFQTSVTLSASNILHLSLAGLRGSSRSVEVYGADPPCP